MHSTFFGVKRVHQRLLAVSRELLAGTGLTPARFDLLRILETHGEGVGQQKVVALLGVSAATVSRMVTALESLGHVARVRGLYSDGRLVFLRLTHAGRLAVRRATRAVIGSGGADLLAASAFTTRWWNPRRELCALEDVLAAARRALADSAPFRHPWTTVDLWYEPSLAELLPEYAHLFPS